MRYFMPGKDGFPWLVGVAAFAIVAVATSGYLFPASNAPEVAPAAAAATPASAVPPVFAAIPEKKTVHTESFFDFSGRIAAVEAKVDTAAAAIPSPPIIPEGPAAVPPAPKKSSRCARATYRMPAIARESILDDMEAKYEAARAVANRRFAAHERCLREIVPNKGG